ncbi:MAG: CCA tRNA nucleotidyltransferase [Proteobacteria bacterium]|nr:CCA tRNA nucleotidyltransferase [Pseudomonadota bacterium]
MLVTVWHPESVVPGVHEPIECGCGLCPRPDQRRQGRARGNAEGRGGAMSKNRIVMPDWLLTRESARVMAALGKKDARFVGGAVRDAIVGKPVKDIDIATRLTPEEVIHLLQKKQIKVIPTGIKHGTVTAVLDGQSFEITTLRKDVNCDGRHAEVAFTSDWEEDAARRDFTINAMYLDVKGNLYDYFGGREDLAEGHLRFIGDAASRIQEDYLRILRLFRFHAYYGKVAIDKETLKVCQHFAPKIATLSGERIQAEMFKLLKADNPAVAMQAMVKAKVFAAATGVPKPNINAFLELCDKNVRHVQYIHLIRLLALLPKLQAVKIVGDITERWKLSNNYRDALKNLAKLSLLIKARLTLKDQRKLCRLYLNDAFAAAVHVAMARDPEHASYFKKMIQMADKWRAPAFPLTGKDVMAVGVPSGRQVGTLLKMAEEAWEESGYTLQAQQLLKLVQKHA